MEGLQRVYDRAQKYIQDRYIPTTKEDIFPIVLFIAATVAITGYFMRYTLFRWLYIGSAIILVASWYKIDQKENPIKGEDPMKGMFILGQ